MWIYVITKILCTTRKEQTISFVLKKLSSKTQKNEDKKTRTKNTPNPLTLEVKKKNPIHAKHLDLTLDN